MRFETIISEEEIRILDKVIIKALECEDIGEVDRYALIKFIGGLRYQLEESRKYAEKWGE